MVKPGINWRTQIDIDEENRLRKPYDPDRVTAVMTLQCEKCKCELTEIHHADGRRHFVEHGVRSVLGKGVYCRTCPE